MINEIIFMEIRLLGEFCQKYKMSRFITADEYFMGKQCVLWEFWTYLFFLCANEGFWNYHNRHQEYFAGKKEDISNVLKTKGAI